MGFLYICIDFGQKGAYYLIITSQEIGNTKMNESGFVSIELGGEEEVQGFVIPNPTVRVSQLRLAVAIAEQMVKVLPSEVSYISLAQLQNELGKWEALGY